MIKIPTIPFVVSVIPLTVCLILAGVLLFMNKEGWGWFLFVSLFLTPSWSEEDEKEK